MQTYSNVALQINNLRLRTPPTMKSRVAAGKNVVCLHIPDIYRYMEPALSDELKAALNRHVEVPK